MPNDIFGDFILEEKVSDKIIDIYNRNIPEKVLEVWRKYGFGSILNGYLKIVNPEEFQVLLDHLDYKFESLYIALEGDYDEEIN